LYFIEAVVVTIETQRVRDPVLAKRDVVRGRESASDCNGVTEGGSKGAG
jgi:ribose 1,5-bisphosphokinase PhnN